MEKAHIGMRIVLGLILVVFGLNKFLNFMPQLELGAEAADFFGALVDTGYMMPFIAFVEIATGVLLLLNKYTALALVLIFPILLNALLFHLFLDLPNIAVAALAVILNVTLFFANKPRYEAILKP